MLAYRSLIIWLVLTIGSVSAQFSCPDSTCKTPLAMCVCPTGGDDFVPEMPTCSPTYTYVWPQPADASFCAMLADTTTTTMPQPVAASPSTTFPEPVDACKQPGATFSNTKMITVYESDTTLWTDEGLVYPDAIPRGVIFLAATSGSAAPFSLYTCLLIAVQTRDIFGTTKIEYIRRQSNTATITSQLLSLTLSPTRDVLIALGDTSILPVRISFPNAESPCVQSWGCSRTPSGFQTLPLITFPFQAYPNTLAVACNETCMLGVISNLGISQGPNYLLAGTFSVENGLEGDSTYFDASAGALPDTPVSLVAVTGSTFIFGYGTTVNQQPTYWLTPFVSTTDSLYEPQALVLNTVTRGQPFSATAYPVGSSMQAAYTFQTCPTCAFMLFVTTNWDPTTAVLLIRVPVTIPMATNGGASVVELVSLAPLYPQTFALLVSEVNWDLGLYIIDTSQYDRNMGAYVVGTPYYRAVMSQQFSTVGVNFASVTAVARQYWPLEATSEVQMSAFLAIALDHNGGALSTIGLGVLDSTSTCTSGTSYTQAGANSFCVCPSPTTAHSLTCAPVSCSGSPCQAPSMCSYTGSCALPFVPTPTAAPPPPAAPSATPQQGATGGNYKSIAIIIAVVAICLIALLIGVVVWQRSRMSKLKYSGSSSHKEVLLQNVVDSDPSISTGYRSY